MPLDLLQKRGTVVTNGAGINAITIAEYVVMGMLTVAKGYRDVVRAQERREWLIDSPGKVELYGSKELLLGYGAKIGRASGRERVCQYVYNSVGAGSVKKKKVLVDQLV